MDCIQMNELKHYHVYGVRYKDDYAAAIFCANSVTTPGRKNVFLVLNPDSARVVEAPHVSDDEAGVAPLLELFETMTAMELEPEAMADYLSLFRPLAIRKLYAHDMVDKDVFERSGIPADA